MTELGGTGTLKVTIGTLPDIALLEIFDFFMAKARVNGWHTLVHVCRSWRCVVFGSPRRLGLELRCTNTTSVTKMLAIWPVLPIRIEASYTQLERANGMDNIFAALKHRNRVCCIVLAGIPNSQLKRLATVQGPFPALKYLTLFAYFKDVAVLPDSFLGGSTPRLTRINLRRISFPSLPKLLLSARDLVALYLMDIPHSGYISPEAIVTGLSTLTRLEDVQIEFRSPRSHPHQASRRLLPQMRTVLPALLNLGFKGVSEYLEVLVAQISAPRLRTAYITFFNQLAFDTLQFPQFIGRAEKFKALDQAEVVFRQASVEITLSPRIKTVNRTVLMFTISCRALDWQHSSLAQVCSSFLTPFATKHLHTREISFWRPLGQDDMDSNQWLELLRPFASVKSLYLSKKLAICIAHALQDLAADGITDILPALQNFFLKMPEQSGPVENAFTRFVTARRLSGHPVVVHLYKRGTWVVDYFGDN
jgi:hypothetical protein